jgi:hypothetical protein
MFPYGTELSNKQNYQVYGLYRWKSLEQWNKQECQNDKWHVLFYSKWMLVHVYLQGVQQTVVAVQIYIDIILMHVVSVLVWRVSTHRTCQYMPDVSVHAGRVSTRQTCQHTPDMSVHAGHVSTHRACQYMPDMSVHAGHVSTHQTCQYTLGMSVHARRVSTCRNNNIKKGIVYTATNTNKRL